MFADKDFYVFLVLFSKTITFQLNSTKLSEKIVIVQEELDGIDIVDIGNLKDLIRMCSS